MDPRLATQAPSLEGDHSQFAIGFDPRDRERVLEIWDSILQGRQWTEGEWVARFEEAWSGWNGLPAVALGGWAGGALAALEFAGLRGETVLCPSNTFMATPLSGLQAGGGGAVFACHPREPCLWLSGLLRHGARHRPPSPA